MDISHGISWVPSFHDLLSIQSLIKYSTVNIEAITYIYIYIDQIGFSKKKKNIDQIGTKIYVHISRAKLGVVNK